jgi:hypothetical protein
LNEKIKEMKAYRKRILADLQKEYRKLNKDFRPYVEEGFNNFIQAVDEMLFELSNGIPPSLVLK